MANGNQITSNASGFSQYHRSLLDNISQSDNTNGSTTQVSFNARAQMYNTVSWSGWWHLSTQYKDNSTGTAKMVTTWNPASINTTSYSTGSWYTHHTINSGSLSFARKASSYTVTLHAVWQTPWGNSTATEDITIPALPTPSAPTNCKHVRDSDSQNTVSWTNAGANPRSNNLVERSVNGGGYSQVASVAGSASSYVDKTTQADQSYAYRVRAVFTANSVSKYSNYSSNTTATYNSPASPSGLSVSRNTDFSVKVSFTNSSNTATGLEYQRSNNASSWSSAVAVSGKVTTFTDQPGPNIWYYRVRNTRSGLSSAWSAASSSVDTLTTPSAPTSCTHARNSDSQNTVSWTNAGANPRSNNLVERSVNGGGYSQVASVAGSASSYVDKTTQADQSYAYRVRAVFTASGVSKHSGFSNNSTATFNSPIAPTSLSVSRNTDNSVKVSFTNSSYVATGLEYQRSSNASSWSSSVVVNAKVTTFTDQPGGGTWYYRVRNTRSSLTSAWSATSPAVLTLIAPAAPTLTAPASGAVASLANTNTRFSWKHNPIDGSVQTAAQVRTSINGGSTWASSLQINNDVAFLDVENSMWEANAQVLWQVRTKGAHADYGPWSSSGSFVVRQVPQVNITSPASNSDLVSTLPIGVEWSYTDQSGTQQAAVLSLLHANGQQIWSKSVSGTSYTLSASDVLPINNTQHTLQLHVTSTSTLQAQTTRQFTTDYQEPSAPYGQAEIDLSKSSVSLAVEAGEGQGPSTATLSILRRHADGRQVSIVSHAPSGTSLDDPYCPIEQDITYIFVAHALSGAVSFFELPLRIPGNSTTYWINYGNEVCAVMLNSSSSRETEHDVELFETAGGDYPLAFYGRALKATGSFSGSPLKKGDLIAGKSWPTTTQDFDGLAAHTGTVVIRMPGWDAFVADASVAQDVQEDSLERVSIKWRRVRNHGLAI